MWVDIGCDIRVSVEEVLLEGKEGAGGGGEGEKKEKRRERWKGSWRECDGM